MLSDAAAVRPKPTPCACITPAGSLEEVPDGEWLCWACSLAQDKTFLHPTTPVRVIIFSCGKLHGMRFCNLRARILLLLLSQLRIDACAASCAHQGLTYTT